MGLYIKYLISSLYQTIYLILSVVRMADRLTWRTIHFPIDSNQLIICFKGTRWIVYNPVYWLNLRNVAASSFVVHQTRYLRECDCMFHSAVPFSCVVCVDVIMPYKTDKNTLKV